MTPQNGSELTERRKGLHELSEQIQCLREEFHGRRELIERRMDVLDEWRKDAQPIIHQVTRAMWMVSGATVLLTVSSAIVLWVWMQDHQVLSDVAKLSLSNGILLQEMQKIDARHERALERLQEFGNQPNRKD